MRQEMCHAMKTRTRASQNETPSLHFSTLRIARGVQFAIAIGDEATLKNDPVAAAYRAGSIAPLSALLDIALAVLQPGDRVLDLGAHLGGFALTAAALGCEVIAVEASPRHADLLQVSADHNRFTQLHVVHAAVGDRSGSVEFSSHGPWGHVATPATGMPAVTVPAVRVDDLMADRGWDGARFVKLDVEGSEVRALLGMPRLLERPDAPLIFFESNRHTLGFYGQSHHELKAALRRFGYVVHALSPEGLRPTEEGDEQPASVCDYVAARELPPKMAAWKPASRSLWRRLAKRLGLGP
jgi:FkbM family methyltransferase